MKRQCLFVFGLLLIVAVALTHMTLAAPAAPTQSAGALDTIFDPGEGANDFVFALAVQPNGQVLIGGQFTQTNSATHNAIARLGANGSPDTTYNASVTGTGYVGVGSIAIQSDGKAVIAGWFTHVNGTARANIARLTDTGALDTDFDPGAGVTGSDAYLNIVKLQSDGKPVIGGAFASVGGTARNNIARLTITGTLDTGFDPGTGTNGEVNAIAVQPSDGQVLIGGDFITVTSSIHNRLARLNTNGSIDSTFAPDVNGPVLAIAVQPDNKIVIGGTFTMTNGVARNRLARLNADGTLDTAFDPDVNREVDTIALQPNGKVIIGGKFTTVGGTGRARIARLNADGSLDAGFDPGDGASYTVYAAALQSDGKILIGGGFQTIGGVSRNRIARLWGDRYVFLPLVLKGSS